MGAAQFYFLFFCVSVGWPLQAFGEAAPQFLRQPAGPSQAGFRQPLSASASVALCSKYVSTPAGCDSELNKITDPNRRANLKQMVQQNGSLAEANCTTQKSLMDQFGIVRNQDGTGWCYANVGADMFTYRIRQIVQNKIDRGDFTSTDARAWVMHKPISASAIALDYTMDDRKDSRLQKTQDPLLSQSWGGANLYWLARSIHRICPEEEFKSEINTDERKADPQEYSALIKQIEVKSFLLRFDHRSADCKDFIGSAQKIFPHASLEGIKDAITHSTYQKEFFDQVSQTVCQRPLKIDPSQLKIESMVLDKDKSNGWKMIDKINSLVGSGKPAAIDYNIRDMTGNPLIPAPGDHASIVVGREFRNGECNFIVRNSWGVDGCPFNPSQSANCAGMKGNYYVPVSQLMPALQSVDNFDN